MGRRILQLARGVAAIVAVWPALAWGIVPTGRLDLAPAAAHRSPSISAGNVELPLSDPLTEPLAFSSNERWLFVDAEDSRLDEHSLVEAALIAGGMADAGKIRSYCNRFEALRDEVRRLGGLTTDVLAKTEAIHQLLHTQLLHRYDADITNLAATFDMGVYNCASATLLFVVLAADAGLNVQAFELPGHVRAAVSDGVNQWEVEITSPKWSEAVRRLETQAANRRDVSPIGLIAMIYYNRGIDAFQDRQFAAAIAANRRALLLDSSNHEARGNLLAAVNNWALALCDAGQFDAAESLLAAGMKFEASHQAFTHNAAYVRRLKIEAAPVRATID